MINKVILYIFIFITSFTQTSNKTPETSILRIEEYIQQTYSDPQEQNEKRTRYLRKERLQNALLNFYNKEILKIRKIDVKCFANVHQAGDNANRRNYINRQTQKLFPQSLPQIPEYLEWRNFFLGQCLYEEHNQNLNRIESFFDLNENPNRSLSFIDFCCDENFISNNCLSRFL